MEFKRKSRLHRDRNIFYEHLEQQYPCNVLMYQLPPSGNIQLDEFKELILERLKVLRVYEQARHRNLKHLSDDWKEFVLSEMTKGGLKDYIRLLNSSGSGVIVNSISGINNNETELQARRKDYVSHFIMRLVYCRSDELRRWFVEHEMELFKHKFSNMTSTDIKRFLELHNLNFASLSAEEKNIIKDGLYESTMGQSVTKIEMLDFYKIPIQQVPDLVRMRRCYIKKGFAYITINDVISVVSSLQQEIISDGLQEMKIFTHEIDADERLSDFLKSVHKSYIGKDYAIGKHSQVAIESLDDLSKKSFPLCMRMCHDYVRTNHHIKHDGRMQYGLFLKGIGVKLEDSIRFWREEFTKQIDTDTFIRRYQYNIEHNYGIRGSKFNYSPFSCLKIISNNVSPIGTIHGCPFKTCNKNMLNNKLMSDGISLIDSQQIMQYVVKGHYQLACGKYFQIMHETNTEVNINHPNSYFEQSQVVINERAEKKSVINERQKKCNE